MTVVNFRSFFEKIDGVLSQLLGSEAKKDNHAANLRLVMLQPILRVKDCTKLLNKLSENAPEVSHFESLNQSVCQSVCQSLSHSVIKSVCMSVSQYVSQSVSH